MSLTMDDLDDDAAEELMWSFERYLQPHDPSITPRTQEAARRVDENDPHLRSLLIGHSSSLPTDQSDGVFNAFPESFRGPDFTRLGEGIANNTHLESVMIWGHGPFRKYATATFCDSFKYNVSIHALEMVGCEFSRGRPGQRILESFRENCTHLTSIDIRSCNLGNGGIRALASTLAACRSLESIHIDQVVGEFLEDIVAAIRGHDRLRTLRLEFQEHIRQDGIELLSTILRDPRSNLRTLGLDHNILPFGFPRELKGIDSEGLTVLLNSLANNRRLTRIDIRSNLIMKWGFNNLSNLLCDTSSVQNTFASNHTLSVIKVERIIGGGTLSDEQTRLLRMNKCKDKSLVAVKKILLYHSNLDMSPFFEWDMKMLPIAVAWFDGAIDKTGFDEESLRARKLSAVYQFVRAMPMMARWAPRRKTIQWKAPGFPRGKASTPAPRRKGVGSAVHEVARIFSLGRCCRKDTSNEQ